MGYVKYLLWTFLAKVVLGIIYITVIAEGLRYLVPPLGQKLHRIPFLSFLRDYEATYQLDLAPFFALFLLIAVFWLWGMILKLWLLNHNSHALRSWNVDSFQGLITLLGAVILGADCILFYVSMAHSGWGTAFSFSALIATAAYLAILIFVSLVSIVLRYGE